MGDRLLDEGGYQEVLHLAFPLILSMGSWSIMHFLDRVFLTWYDRDSLAAALPAGLLNYVFGCFFLGTSGYLNTFVAQYSGAEQPKRVGASVWQGIYFSIIAGFIMLAFIPVAGSLFKWIGHDPNIQALETSYFKILCFMGGPAIMMAAVSSFFSGRGDTWTVMWVNIMATVVNGLLDYAWIFGVWGFPRWGIQGAAWATVIAHFFGAALFMALMLRPNFQEVYHTLKAWRLDWVLFRRIIRFGMPNGIQLMLETLGFTLFALLVGRLGTVSLAAINLTFSINTLAFLPMVGMGVAVSTLVGRYLGKDKPDLAETSTKSALYLSLIYMGMMSVGYLVIPEFFLKPFAIHSDLEALEPVMSICIVLLRFVAVYSIFDAFYIVFSSAIKGAGDTWFVMWVTTLVSWCVMVVPVYLACNVFGWGLYVAFSFLSAYIIFLSIIFLFRFRGRKWQSMLVIEGAIPSVREEI